jgi:hypothetical protein
MRNPHLWVSSYFFRSCEGFSLAFAAASHSLSSAPHGPQNMGKCGLISTRAD